VLSHWILDLIVHFHDLPLYPGNSPYVGFGLWGSMTATIIIESAILVGGFVIYQRATAAKNKTGAIVPWVIIILLIVIQASSFVGPPPENVNMLAWSAQFQWLFVLLAYWGDRNRNVSLLS